MRTTVTLDADVRRLLQNEMHRSRSNFKQSLNRAVRQGLAPVAEPRAEPFVLEASPMGLRAGIDERRLGQLADQLETEALVERMRKAEAAERRRQATAAGAATRR